MTWPGHVALTLLFHKGVAAAPRARWSCPARGGRNSSPPTAHARRTRITMTLQGRRAGTACWLAGVVASRPLGDSAVAYSRQLSQARPRTASTSLTLRPLHEGAATARWRFENANLWRGARGQKKGEPQQARTSVTRKKLWRGCLRPLPSGACERREKKSPGFEVARAWGGAWPQRA